MHLTPFNVGLSNAGSRVRGSFSAALLLCFLAGLWYKDAARAQNSSAPSTISYEQAVFRSLNEHPDLAGYEFRMQAADARVRQAGVGPRPELGLEIEDVAGTGDFNAVESAQTTLGVSWLLQCEVIDRRVQVASGRTSMITTQQQIAALDVAADTARYFLMALAQQDRLSLARRAEIQAREGLADIRRHVRVGKLPQAEASRARAEVEQRSLAAEDVEHEYAIAKYQLAAQWGERSPQFAEVDGSLAISIPAVDIASLRLQISNNPNLAIFLNRERIADAEIALAQAEAGIQWRINAGIRRIEATDDFSLVAGISIPLGRRNRNHAEIEALMAEQSQYRSERQALEVALETRVYVMAQQLMHSRHVADAYLKRIIPSLEQALADIESAYKQGKYSYYELASAQQDLIDARLSFLEAQYRGHLYWIEIEKLTGLSLARSGGGK